MTGQHFRARVTVQLNAGVNDPQGLTVRGSLHDLGFSEVADVRIGKLITSSCLPKARRRPPSAPRPCVASCWSTR